MAGFFEKIFGRHEEASWMYDLEFFQDMTTKVYLKKWRYKQISNF